MLGVAFFQTLLLTLLRTLRRGAPSGLARFRENYDADRLDPVTPAERAALPALGRCIACGLCDVPRRAGDAAEARPLMVVMLAASRQMPDFEAAERLLAGVGDAELTGREADCPAGVPMREVARFVRAHAHAAA